MVKTARHTTNSQRCRALLSWQLPLMIAMQLGGCWSSSSPEPTEPASEEAQEDEAKELSPPDTSGKSADSTPQADVARNAKRLFQAKMYSVCRESLQTLSSQGTPGAYRTFAEIKLADSYFFNGEHSEASKRYEEFIKSYPMSPETPYAKLQAARSYLALARGAGRDRKPLETALSLLDGLVQSYPDSDYGAIARQSRGPIVEQLAAYDRSIIEFYERFGNAEAVAERTKSFDKQWGARLQETTSAETNSSEKRLLPLLPARQPRDSVLLSEDQGYP